MTVPKTQKHVCVFVGSVEYYKDMWAKQSHILHTLTILTSHKAKFKWTYLEHKAFDDIKFSVSRDTLLACP